jgi:hypothetical protein
LAVGWREHIAPHVALAYRPVLDAGEQLITGSDLLIDGGVIAAVRGGRL